MSDCMKQYEDDFSVYCYSEEEITNRVLQVINEKVEELYHALEEIKNIAVYSFNIINEKKPQIALKIYKTTNYEEVTRKLVGVLDISINENDYSLEFAFYNFNISSSYYAYAQFINGVWGYNDGIPEPIQEDRFSTKEIDNLIQDILNMY